ncbi:hypothetical protein C4580_01105 [Candidatus Woesearchaeota archaeon]|nr:MAG: hypothetical protein C4580_01105 [Candidatus Woesearchaeota archaeon]
MILQFSITKRALYFLITLSILITGALLTVAFGGNNPSLVGHSRGEISGVGPVIVVQGTTETAIQTAIDEAAVLGGGTVLMHAGTYTIAGPINLTSNISLIGQGSGTILQATTNSIDIITENSAALLVNVRLQDFAIRPGSATGLDGVVFTDVTGLIEGLDISGIQGRSISVTRTIIPSPMTTVIRRNTIVSTGTDGIVVSGGSDIPGANVIVTQNVVNGTVSDAIDCQGHSEISNNDVRGGIGIRGAAQCIISGNHVTSTTGAGIDVSGAQVHISNNVVILSQLEGITCTCAGTIVGNTVRLWSQGAGTHAGIRASAVGGATNPAVLISSNWLEAFVGGGEGINASGVVAITGNHVLPQTGFFGIAANGNDFTVNGNVVENGGIWTASRSEYAVTGNVINGNFDLNATSGSSFAITGNFVQGDLDATGSAACTITGNVVSGVSSFSGCSAVNNI